MSQDDDGAAALLGAAKAGDAQALQRLLASQQQRIWRFSVKMCRNPDEAGDVLQDTLLAAARGVRRFRGGSSLSTWLYTIARSFCVKKRRRSKFAPKQEDSLDAQAAPRIGRIPDERATPEEALGAAELQRSVDEAIRALPPMYREVVLLRDIEGLSAPEVAKVLGLRIEAVKSRLHRGRANLRASLRPVLEGGGPARTRACPDVVTLFSRYLEDDIDPQLCARMQEHVAQCEHCRAASESLQEALTVCRALPTPQVPPAVKASVRGALNEFLEFHRPAGQRNFKGRRPEESKRALRRGPPARLS